MECMQCVAEVQRNGAIYRCRRTSCYTLPYCWQHLKSQAHLRIGRTRLLDPATNRRFQFKGLFVCNTQAGENAVVFNTGENIVSYIGELLTEDQLNLRYPGDDETAPYVEAVETVQDDGTWGPRVYVDGARVRGVASMANDAREGSQCVDNSPCDINAIFESGDANNSYPVLTATRPIRNGEEIFVAYGSDYWDGVNHPHITSPKGVYNRIEYRC